MPPKSANGAKHSPATMLARRLASARYRENLRNVDELREKARQRMERHRDHIKQTTDGLEDHRARAREASRRYRERHARELAQRQRIRRMHSYEKKYGHKAWLERCQKLQEQRRAAAEEEEWRLYQIELNGADREREAAETLRTLGG